ncbi:lamin tail domain-containing protein, partial [candidate division KSB1 bacterium]|nr:lamin tail domain-containing protein [candidate division KSB1 bacterium]
MKKLLALLVVAFVTGMSPALAQNHLLISEFVVTPTPGEFVEIYNPTASAIDLSNYYLSDEVFNNNNNYINVVKGGFTAFSSDFMVKFPNGTSIGPKQFLTIAFSGAGFNTTYGKPANFEIRNDDANTPDMDRASASSVGVNAGLSDDGEVLMLFYWDGQNDLVQDVDYVVWGDKAEAVDKTGVSIDGPDADANTSTYFADTPVANQLVVNTENDADANPHDAGNSAQRKLEVEDLETWTGGNGITGHNETSENLSWMGGIWSLNAAATPGGRGLGDSLNIADIQFVRADAIGASNADNSPMVGDTVTISGIFMQGPRDIFLAQRWGGFLQDERGGPWSGFFIIQNDSGVSGTLLSAAQAGDKIKVTGVVSEFPTGLTQQSITQFTLLTNPVTPIEFLDFGLPLPAPIVLKPGDLGATAGTTNSALSERWESTLVRFENLTVTANGLPGNLMTASDETGSITLDDYFNAIFNIVNPNGGVWPGFPAGTRINVTGFIRGGTSQGTTTINPRSLADIEVASAPPEITNLQRASSAVNSASAAVISATIIDAQTAVAGAEIQYRVEGGPIRIVPMDVNGNQFSGSIPPQANGARVEYFLTARDTEGFGTTSPSDTSAYKYFYIVRDAGLTIYDLQYTPYRDTRSPYSGMKVTVTGIVTTDSTDFSFYWIQDGTDPWSGIQVFDQSNRIALGDRVTVTGTVTEFRDATEITTIESAVVLSSNNPIPPPIELTTGQLATGAPTSERYEGMLVRVKNVVVTEPFADGASNFGEFSVSDGSGSVRIDDESFPFRGNLDSTFARGDSLISITGIHHESFANKKIEPRNNADVVRKPTAVRDNNPQAVLTFELAPNYPNPFNPETTIRYQVARGVKVNLTIYNVLGQKVRTL